jgi:hypothetical protein
MATYEHGWDDCLDEVIFILDNTNDVKKAKDRLESMQIAVKSKKRKKIHLELGIIDGDRS